MSEPIPVRVTRYACPSCSRTHSSKAGARRHIGRCWYNPEARGCKTCKHYEPAEPSGDYCFPGRFCRCNEGTEESCAVGVSLAGSMPDPLDPHDSEPVRPGPIVGCEKWERADDLA